MLSRRRFVGTVAAGAAGLAARTSARSYAQIIGANERVSFAVIGLNGRAGAHLSALHTNRKDARIAQVCDVDSTILDRFVGKTTQTMGEAPKAEKDFRRVLAAKDVDVITIATPDHWHTPMAILGLAAGKHVYVEKPCSHNPEEGLMLIAAQKKYGKLCQMGSQQRSSPHTIEIVGKIHDGLIGRAYWAETWYANRRKPIGVGKVVPVPATLDWDLWQGPAPRQAYKDNVHPYNWHWFRTWGTGETLNNGTHEVDVARWALGAEYPKTVTAAGGRYAAKDDWEFYDTLDTAFEYPDQMITWRGDCCSGKTTYGRDRGIMVHGTTGSVLIDRAGYEVYDPKDQKTAEFHVPGHAATASSDTVGADSMTDAHFANMIAAIRTGEKLRQPVAQGNVAVTMLQYSNIAYFTGRKLTLDATGKIVGDKDAEAMTRRSYEKGWEPKVKRGISARVLSNMQYVLALDQGTTSSRAILFGHGGEIAGVAQRELKQIYPDIGWMEQDPYEILTSQMNSAQEVLGKAHVSPQDIVALGITNQRETTIVWERDTGKPVYNAIVWQDRRSAPLCGKLASDGAEETIRRKTGLVIDPYFSATKIAWILDNVPGVRTQAEQGKLAFGTVDTWLAWNLTGGKLHITDRTNASRTMLYNVVEDRWDEDLLRLLGIPASMMPEVCWSSEPVGRVTASLGLGEVAIAGIAGDQQAALFGQLGVSPGLAKNTYGTGCFLLRHIGGEFMLSQERLITTLACSPARKLEYALEGSVFVGGAVVQWLRDNMRFFAASPDVESIAAEVDSAENVVFVPAFTGLGAPYWDPHASGMIIGLQRSTQIGHIARAALESIGFQVADVLHAMDKDTGEPFRELRVDGGAAANDMLMQFQADLLQLPVRRPAVLETTAQGAAYLAGLAVNFWGSVEEITKLRGPDTVFEPRAGRKEMEARQAKWQDAVRRAGGWNS